MTKCTRGLEELFEQLDMAELVPGEIKGLQLPNIEEVQKWKEILDRRIVFNEYVTDYVMIYSQLIIEWNKEDKDIPIEERKPIKILIHSYGGELNISLSLINLMSISKTPIITINLGQNASAAGLIFLAGHKRLVMPGSKILIHEGGLSLQGQTTQIIENIEAHKKVEKEIDDYILSKTKIDKKLYTKKKKIEWFINDVEAIELGIADEIITDIDVLFN